MNESEKLLRKISKQERNELLILIDTLNVKKERDLLHPIRLKGSDFYRIRKGKFRIIYHLHNDKAVIDTVRFRNEKTYREF